MEWEAPGRKWTKGVQRAIPYIRSFVEKGISASQGLDILKAGGLGVRRTDYLAAYREIAEVPRRRPAIASTRDDRLLSPGAFVEYNVTMRHRYEYVIETTFRDPMTGEKGVWEFTASSELRMSKQQAYFQESEAEEDIYFPFAGWEMVGQRMTEARHRAGDPWA